MSPIAPIVIQELLRTGKESLDELVARFKLLIKRHPKWSNLVQFRYDMLESDMSLPLVQQCRGLILDEATNWATVARPFDKFWNEGEGHAACIDWTTARVQEKLDGTLIILYYYAGQWNAATLGMPDAGGQVDSNDFTFADLFWRTLQAHEELDRYRDLTLLFELTSPYNRIVVKHAEPKATLISARSLKTGCEFAATGYTGKWPVVHEFPLNTLEDIVASFAAINPTSQEGYVVVDKNWSRIKIKHPGYVALHHLRGEGLNPKRIAEIVRLGEVSEILAHFPEWAPDIEAIKVKFDTRCQIVQSVYDHYKGAESQKDFALWVKDRPDAWILFGLRKGQWRTPAEALKACPIDRVLHLLQFEHGKNESVDLEEIA